jgi:NADH-quinone oxidoreductase subunit G
MVFGSELSGAAIADLVGFGSKLHGKVRYMALGDYANSRGAADMGVLPDRGPGYAKTSKTGMTAPQMVEAAQQGKLKALYVVGANPLAHFGTLGYGRGKTELLIVHELFMTETARQADIVFPAVSAYEKDGTVTNTSGEVQLLHKAAEVMGPRTDFDLLRILSHQLEKQGLGKAFHYKNVAAVFEEIRKTVPGYDLELTGLLTGGAESARVEVKRNGSAPYDVPVGLIHSAQDTLFTSGTLGRFCTTIESVPEAQAKS